MSKPPSTPEQDSEAKSQLKLTEAECGSLLNQEPSIEAEVDFADAELSSFCSSHLVPGISKSLGKMLLARIISHADTHRYRVGTHCANRTVNRPKSVVYAYHQDDSMRYDCPKGSDLYSETRTLKQLRRRYHLLCRWIDRTAA